MNPAEITHLLSQNNVVVLSVTDPGRSSVSRVVGSVVWSTLSDSLNTGGKKAGFALARPNRLCVWSGFLVIAIKPLTHSHELMISLDVCQDLRGWGLAIDMVQLLLSPLYLLGTDEY